MPEIRYKTRIEYPKDLSGAEKSLDKAIITQEEPYEVSDEQIYQEQIEQSSNDGIHSIKENLDNWDTLSNTAKREALKDLLTCMLNLYQGQY